MARAGEETAHLVRNEAIAIRADVTDPDCLQAAIRATVDKFSRLDVAHNNAGGYWHSIGVTREPCAPSRCDGLTIARTKLRQGSSRLPVANARQLMDAERVRLQPVLDMVPGHRRGDRKSR